MTERSVTTQVRVIGLIVLLQLGACAQSNATAAACSDTTSPAQPHLQNGISLTVQRLAVGCGVVRVSNGIPLPPGLLSATQLSQVRVFVGGQEQRLHVEALESTHTDGSLRAVLIQFDYPLTSDRPVPGELVVGQARGTSDIAKAGGGGATAAVALPSSPDYLVSTQLVGPTITVAAATALSPVFKKYEDDFTSFAEIHWKAEGAAWEDNYYDRALIYYAWWIRTGNVEYWKRATTMAVNYRRDYLEKNNYGTSAHWSQIEGIELHYLLTGDEASRLAVGRVADVFDVEYYMDHLSNLAAPMDNRMQARLLMAFLTAWRLNAESQHAANWGTLLPKALTAILASQDTSGAYRFVQIQCGHNKPFMVGLLNDAMIKYHAQFNADARILPAIRKSDDYMWSKDWNSVERAFVYLGGSCPGDEGGPSPDLNNLVVNGYAWVYRQTGNAAYRDRADQIFAGAVDKAWLSGSKQFNQEYTSSFRYLAYRQSP
jgi:hypothetical protein